jgi:hypothetical protein
MFLFLFLVQLLWLLALGSDGHPTQQNLKTHVNSL